MAIDVGALRGALSLALTTPDDRALAIALTGQTGGGGSGTTTSSAPPDAGGDPEILRIQALVDLAREGDTEAFGQLYDHYVNGIYRFIHYRVGSAHLAEDLTSETFVRGLRAIQRFNWQGKDFGAWLTTIARNLVVDHFKSSRARLEIVADEVPERRTTESGPEEGVLALLTNEILHDLVNQLPPEQRDCILMRFIQGLSIAQTAAAIGRSEGAVKQLQLRAVRNLAKLVPEGLR